MDTNLLRLAHELLSGGILMLFEEYGTTDPENLIRRNAPAQAVEFAQLVARAACELRDPRD